VPAVDGNESRLGQVFLNLIVNAAQSMDEGKADSNELRVTTNVGSDGRVVVEVADTGAGMPPEVQKRLFTPFFTTKPVGVGTGLGLSICHRIVTTLGGVITVESSVGEGSAFRVVLPVAESALPPQRHHESVDAPAVRRGRILVVDDEVVLASLVERVLVEHEVIAMTRAEDALAAVAGGARFDVLLLDLMMPEMTGMDLYAELLTIAPDQAEKTIFLSGGAFTTRARAFLATVDNISIDKPFSVAEFRAIVNERVK
jgi:CheY-like chemotaxis protein